mmetsp:Transcript_61753/g.155922  ORF Transcript_61753/g.155922 Transcript_61753/m.155922 type:complete len:856 (-) Transcript_61753:141-2708(-)
MAHVCEQKQPLNVDTMQAAIAELILSAETMIAYNSNVKGGKEGFVKLRNELLDKLNALPTTLLIRGTLMQLWQTMPTTQTKTVKTWRVHVFAILREVDYPDAKLNALLKSCRLVPSDIDIAIQTAFRVQGAAPAIADAPQQQRQRQQRSAGQPRHRSSGPAGGGRAALPAGPAATSATTNASVTGGEASAAQPSSAASAPPSVPSVLQGSGATMDGGGGTAGGGGWELARYPPPAAACGGIQRFFSPLPRSSRGPGAAVGGSASGSASSGTSTSASASASSSSCSSSTGSAAPLGAERAANSAGTTAAGTAAQPPSAAAEHWDARDPAGYYRVLQVSPDATLREIARAYKVQALRWHPDKPSGDKQEFVNVVLAYEFLSDVAKRAAYGEPGGEQRTSQAAAAPDTVDDLAAAATAFYAHLLIVPEEAWHHLLVGVNTDTLKKLQELLHQQRAGKPGAGRRTDAAAEPAAGNTAGLKYNAKKGDFWIQVGWRNFKVKPAVVVKDLNQAVDLHIALTSARNSAKARLAALERSAPFLGPSSSLDGCVPMTDAEHLAVLSDEPFVPLVFCSDITVPGSGRKQTPWTTNLQDALNWRLVIRQGLEKRHLEAVNVAKSDMAKCAAEHRKATFASRDRAATSIRDELKRRGVAVEVPPAPPRDDAAALEAPVAGPMALKNEAAAEEIARLQRAVEEERASKLQAIEDGLRALEDERASKLQAIEDGQCALEDERAAKEHAEGAKAAAEGLAKRFALDAGREREAREYYEREAHQTRGTCERLQGQVRDLEDEVLRQQELAMVSARAASSSSFPRFRLPPPEAPAEKRARLLETFEKEKHQQQARKDAATARAWLTATDPRG